MFICNLRMSFFFCFLDGAKKKKKKQSKAICTF